LSVGDNAGCALADTVDGRGTDGAAGLAGALEVVEAGEAGSAGTGAVAGGAGVRAVGANTAARGDVGIGAAGAVVVGRAGGASRSAVDAFLLSVVVELVGKASLLANGTGQDVSIGTLQTVLGTVLAAIAAGGAGNTDTLEAELVFTAGNGAGTVDRD